MQSAYYAWKIPKYVEQIRSGERIMSDTCNIRKAMLETIEKWNIKEVAAHNARFDYNALNVTQRYVSGSKYRYWFPFDSVDIYDTMKMAQDVICGKQTYKTFCQENGYLTASGQPRKTAEILYRFISGQDTFQEEHTALEDVLIEAEILFYCYRQHQPMRKSLFENKREFTPLTDFQKALSANMKEIPVLRMERSR
jgi:DNA polymerase III epsilon subunit-like protein